MVSALKSLNKSQRRKPHHRTGRRINSLQMMKCLPKSISFPLFECSKHINVLVTSPPSRNRQQTKKGKEKDAAKTRSKHSKKESKKNVSDGESDDLGSE